MEENGKAVKNVDFVMAFECFNSIDIDALAC